MCDASKLAHRQLQTLNKDLDSCYNELCEWEEGRAYTTKEASLLLGRIIKAQTTLDNEIKVQGTSWQLQLKKRRKSLGAFAREYETRVDALIKQKQQTKKQTRSENDDPQPNHVPKHKARSTTHYPHRHEDKASPTKRPRHGYRSVCREIERRGVRLRTHGHREKRPIMEQKWSDPRIASITHTLKQGQTVPASDVWFLLAELRSLRDAKTAQIPSPSTQPPPPPQPPQPQPPSNSSTCSTCKLRPREALARTQSQLAERMNRLAYNAPGCWSAYGAALQRWFAKPVGPILLPSSPETAEVEAVLADGPMFQFRIRRPEKNPSTVCVELVLCSSVTAKKWLQFWKVVFSKRPAVVDSLTG